MHTFISYPGMQPNAGMQATMTPGGAPSLATNSVPGNQPSQPAKTGPQPKPKQAITYVPKRSDLINMIWKFAFLSTSNNDYEQDTVIC